MIFAICGFIGMAVGSILGYFIGGMGTGVGQIMLTIHLTITFGFVGIWLGIIFNKKAMHHDGRSGTLEG